MPTLVIDGREVTVRKGATLMDGARELGIEIPHYCYHPALSIAGNCRMCLVEVEGQPKPVIACKTECADGMVVSTQGGAAGKLRKGALEFLLVNHPLDCPVCDQAGECLLQDYYMKHGLYDSALNEDKVTKQKAVPLGPTIMFDAERCILCSRCVRFLREITETGELGIFERGDRSQVGLFPGKTLSNPYSGNLADLCPVGALTDRDFRFKCRVWYLRSEDSICPGCSRGCNIRIDHNPDRPHHGGGRRVMRLKPRENPAVNQWWLCDEGRYGYKFIDERRILSPLRRRKEVLEAVSWEEALRELASSLETAGERKETDCVGIIPSTQMTNEDMFAVRHFFQERLGFSLIDYRVPVPDGEADEFLRTSDKSPNTRGAEEIFRKLPSRENELIFRARKGKMSMLIVFGYDLKEIYGEDTCRELKEKLGRFVFIGPNENGSLDYADLVLPSSVYAEKEGTFTNSQGRVQRLRRAFAPMGSARPEWEIAQSCVLASGGESVFRSAEEVFLKLAESTPGFSGLTYAKIGCSGTELSGKGHD